MMARIRGPVTRVKDATGTTHVEDAGTSHPNVAPQPNTHSVEMLTRTAEETGFNNGDPATAAGGTANATGSARSPPPCNGNASIQLQNSIPSASPASPAPLATQHEQQRKRRAETISSHDEVVVLKNQLASEREQWEKERRDFEDDAER